MKLLISFSVLVIINLLMSQDVKCDEKQDVSLAFNQNSELNIKVIDVKKTYKLKAFKGDLEVVNIEELNLNFKPRVVDGKLKENEFVLILDDNFSGLMFYHFKKVDDKWVKQKEGLLCSMDGYRYRKVLFLKLMDINKIQVFFVNKDDNMDAVFRERKEPKEGDKIVTYEIDSEYKIKMDESVFKGSE